MRNKANAILLLGYRNVKSTNIIYKSNERWNECSILVQREDESGEMRESRSSATRKYLPLFAANLSRVSSLIRGNGGT